MAQEKKSKTNIRIRVSVILKRDDGRICFVRHYKDGRRYWLLPGGGQSAFEPIFEAANRELKEELCVECTDFNFLFLRESMSKVNNRHIQFLVLEGEGVDFNNITKGNDPRVEGIDFFNSEELASKTIYPDMKDDLTSYLNNNKISSLKSLEWI